MTAILTSCGNGNGRTVSGRGSAVAKKVKRIADKGFIWHVTAKYNINNHYEFGARNDTLDLARFSSFKQARKSVEKAAGRKLKWREMHGDGRTFQANDAIGFSYVQINAEAIDFDGLLQFHFKLIMQKAQLQEQRNQIDDYLNTLLEDES